MTHDPITLFLDAVQKTGLVSEPALLNYSQEIRAEGAGSQEEVAAKLVERKVLTPYQAERILLGEGEDCVLGGRYHLLEKIGSGGMGSVFRARDTKLDRVVAIKVMASHNLSDPDAVARFKREAKALAQLALPNVVQAFDSGEDKGRNFLVMEFVKGLGLDRLMRDKGKLPPTVAADYVYQTAVGLQRAHDRGMIHRDIKPANLLLTSEGDIKILDLGLARFVQDQIPDSEVTRDNVGMGTPDYMAPEQFRDAHGVDARADIYSLGCTLYYLIAGLVPFPGSSLSEKAHAHTNKEPPPLEERCPEIPAGLSMAVAKMLAKRPADRFQSMREVAEALAPYVAGSSPALPSIKQTVSFHGSQIGTMGPRRRHRRPVLIGGGVVLLALMLGLVFVFPPPWWGNTETSDGNQQAGQTNPQPPVDKKTSSGKEQSKPPEPVKPEPPKVVTIPNGLTVSQDGTGQYKTISAALDKVKPGQTIRVLDDAVYREKILIDNSERHQGITLVAPKQAVLELAENAKFALKIDAVPKVTVKGFKFETPAAQPSTPTPCILVEGLAPGVTLTNLQLDFNRPFDGIHVVNSPLQPNDLPIVIRHCRIKTGGTSVVVTGLPAAPASRILIHDNQISGQKGVGLELLVSDTLIAGNTFLNCGQAGVHLGTLLPGSQRLAIANNTFFSNAVGIRLWDEKPPGGFLDQGFHFTKGQVKIANNLLLQAKIADMILIHVDSKTKQAQAKDSKFLLDSWGFESNWRDMTGEGSLPITPLAAKDHRLTNLPILSLAPGSPQFLWPKKDSDLATKGAGTDDPTLPTYVGAVPPEDATPWNWQWTWDAWMHKTLTVSQDAKDQARFDSINAALDKVKPGWTIRVLDDAVYEENLVFNDAARQAGVTLDSVHKATIQANHAMNMILVKGVPGLTLKGLRLQATKPEVNLLAVFPGSDGLNLERVEFVAPQMEFMSPDKNCRGLDIIGGEAPKANTAPMRVHDCLFQNLATGIQFLGTDGALQLVIPPKRIFLCDNVFRHCHQPILFYGPAQDVLVAGNKIIGAKGSGIHVEAMMPGTENILVANNSIFDSHFSVRFWSTTVKGSKVAFWNNLILAPLSPDMVFVNAVGVGDKVNGPGNIPSLLKVWDFSHNWREAKKPIANDAYSKGWIPPNPKDVLQDSIGVLSRNANHKDFLRPAKDSPLATGGAGKDDPDLPTYVGAIPPQGVAAWDWEKTWKAKFERR